MFTETDRTLFLEALDKQEYLGDGVYVGKRSDGVLALYTDDGITTHSLIFLEKDILLALFKYTVNL